MIKNLEESTLPFRKGNEFYWPTDFDDSGYCLSRIQYATNKEELFESGEFSEKLEIVTKNWGFITIVKSALYYHLEFLKNSRKGTHQPPFLWLDWYTLIFVFLNKNTSKKEILDIIEFVYEAPDKETLLGVRRAISSFTAFSFVPISPESLSNLLIFLKIDIVSREALVKESFKKQNLTNLIDFLITMECTVNTDLVLTETLKYYFNTLEKGKPSMKEIEEKVNNLIDFTRLELESFNVFDIMESGEQAKSGSSKLYVFDFNEALLLSLIKNPSNTPLKIFELFESYLYQTKENSIFLIKISFEKGGDLYKLISVFCLACEKEIKFYAKSDYIKSGLTLFSFVFSIIAGSLGLLLFFASSRSVSTRTYMLDQVKAQNVGDVAFTTTTTEGLFLEEIQEKTEETLISPNASTEANKIVRTRPSSFGSIIPHFSKNQVKSSQPVPTTQSVALQAPTPLQVSQKVESAVRLTRSIPRNTTISYGVTVREGLKGNYSTIAFRQSSMDLRGGSFELQLPAPHATEMNALIEKLESKYPGVTLNVSQIYKKEGEVYLPTNKLSLIGTSLQYKDCTAVKQEFRAFVEGRKLSFVENQEATPLMFANPGQLEGDHAKNVVQRDMLKLKSGEGGVVFVGKDEHALIGEARNYSMPNEMGYTPDTAGAMDVMDMIEEDNASAIKSVFVQKDGEAFSAQGYNEEVITRSYKNASNIDREKVQEKVANSGVDENMFLAVNVNQIFDVGMAQNFDDFIELVDDKKIDCKRACKDLNVITKRAFSRRQHAFSVEAHLKKGTPAWRSFNMHEARVKGACERAYQYVADMPGYSETYVDKKVKAEFLGNTPDKPVSLEEAVLITKQESNLNKLKKHPKPLYGGRLYSENQKRNTVFLKLDKI